MGWERVEDIVMNLVPKGGGSLRKPRMLDTEVFRRLISPSFLSRSQPQPEAAISLIHKQPVRWTSQRVVSCDGGGGPLGHPRIFINVDKPQINWCTYCGLPFAHEHHRQHLQSVPRTSYPLEPVGDEAEVGEVQRVTDEAFAQR